MEEVLGSQAVSANPEVRDMAIVSDGQLKLKVALLGEGPPLLMIHGGLVDGRSWSRQHDLGRDLKLVLPDTRGFGGSSGPVPEHVLTSLVDDVCRVADAAGEETVHLLGFSIGGVVAQGFAMRHPKRLRSLILESTFAPPAPRRPAVDDVSSHVERAFSRSFREKEPMFLDEYLDMARENASGGAMAWLRGAVAAAPTSEELSAISVPVAVFHAREDEAIPLSRGMALHSVLPNSVLSVFEGCGHTIHVEKHAEFNPAVLDFIQAAEAKGNA